MPYTESERGWTWHPNAGSPTVVEKQSAPMIYLPDGTALTKKPRVGFDPERT